MRLGILWVGAALVGATWAKAERLPADPYGVCCHITRNWAGEWTDHDVLFREMKRAGISWIRADIDADSAMPKYGQFNDDYIRRALTRPDGERVTALWTTDRRDEGRVRHRRQSGRGAGLRPSSQGHDDAVLSARWRSLVRRKED